MARAELRYLDEEKTKQELVVLVSEDEHQQMETKSAEFMRRHYQQGEARDKLDNEWRQFQSQLLGPAIVRRIDEIERERLPVRFNLDHPSV